MILGLTGSIGSGKTTTARIFQKHGYKVIDADKIGHSLLSKKTVKERIIKEFGTVNRKKLRNIVFSNKTKLNKLNKIMWPLIKKEIITVIKKNKKKKIVIDAAVLVEAGWHKLVDKVIAVIVTQDKIIKRLINTNRYNLSLIKKILKSQLSLKERLQYADYVIDNNKSIKYTKQQVFSLIKLLKSNR